jgi:hypothetical protein
VSLGPSGLVPDNQAPFLYISGSTLLNFGTGFQLQEVKDAGASSYTATDLPV